MALLLLPPAPVRSGVPFKPAKRDREENAESVAMSEAVSLKPKDGDPSTKKAVLEKHQKVHMLMCKADPPAAATSGQRRSSHN